MGVILFIVVVALFVALTPGILLSLPPKGSKLVVALTHGIVFAIVLKLIYKPLWKFTSRLEGMAEGVTIRPSKEYKDVKDLLKNKTDANVNNAISSYIKKNAGELNNLIEDPSKINDLNEKIMLLTIKRSVRL